MWRQRIIAFIVIWLMTASGARAGMYYSGETLNEFRAMLVQGKVAPDAPFPSLSPDPPPAFAQSSRCLP